MIAVPQIGEEEDGHANHVPKSLLVGIIAPRLEETFELVRDRLEASGLRQDRRPPRRADRRRLPAARRARTRRADPRQAGAHRPAAARRRAWPRRRTARPFATAAGLLHFALSERAETAARPARARAGRAERDLWPARSLAEGEHLRQICGIAPARLVARDRTGRPNEGEPDRSGHDELHAAVEDA